MGRLFHPSSIRVPSLPLCPSSHPSLSLFRIISFESTIMGRRGHAGHVFTKVCAPNTKAAWQTGSIPRVAGRRHTTVLSVISRCPLVGRQVVLCCFPSVLPSYSPSHRGDTRGRTTPYIVKDGGISCRNAKISYGSYVLERDLPSFPFTCCQENIIAVI